VCGKLPFQSFDCKNAKKLNLQKKSFFALLYTAGGCNEAAKMLFAQPTDSISNSECWFVGYIYIGYI